MSHLAQNETRHYHQGFAARRSVTHQPRSVRILFVDDMESNVELCQHELTRMDFAVSADWVQDPAMFLERLRGQSYDVIVSDYFMHNWTGLQALDLLRELSLEIPFILSSSNLDDDTVDLFLRKGAFDCIDRDRMNRLPLVVALAMEEKAWCEERNNAQKDLRHSEAHYRALVENPTYGIFRFEVDGRFLKVNEALVKMLGYESKEELMAVNLATEIIRDPSERGQLIESYRKTGNIGLIEMEWRRKDGTPMTVRLSGRQVGLGGSSLEACEVIAEDVTAQRASEDHLRHLAATDPLTGLANYRKLFETLDAEIKRSARTGREFSILLFDLNGMKRINDTHGHLAGNRALCRLADIFRFSCRSIDTAARYGGDEFAIILPEAGAHEADSVGRRICTHLANDREEPALSVSVGIAVYPKHGISIEALLQAADSELYKMKVIQKSA